MTALTKWQLIIGCIFLTVVIPADKVLAGDSDTLKDLMLEKGQITIDEWVELKAEEERRETKALAESRSVGDTPAKAKWYEKFNIRGYAKNLINLALVQIPTGEKLHGLLCLL